MRGVLPDLLFHPDHVIPVPELVAAVVELARHGIAHMFMKPDAVQGQIVILFFGFPDSGVLSLNILGSGDGFQGSVIARDCMR